MNLMTLLNRLLSGGSKGWPRLVGAVLLALVLGYAFLTGSLPDGGAPAPSGSTLSQKAPLPGAGKDATADPSAHARDGPAADARAAGGRPGPGEILVSQLPHEARVTLALILKGGPYPYDKDGTVFGNREGLLPKQRRGYYTEYTMRTPNVKHRGARRIVAGGASGRLVEFYYTDDHYQSFRRIRGVGETD